MQKVSLPQALGALFLTLMLTVAARAATLQSALPQTSAGPSLAYLLPREGLLTAGDNYLAEVTAVGRFTWPLEQMPLRVYIEDGTGTPGYRDWYPDFIRRAFSEWQTISDSKLTWTEVASPAAAAIVCTWTAVARPKGNGVETGETKTTIQRNPFTGAGKIISARVSVLTSLLGRSFSDTDTYKTCLHEVGHALGLQGHSSTVGDIMYPVLNANQTPFLKERDRNTINALYVGRNEPSSYPQFNGESVARRQYFEPRFAPQVGTWATHLRPYPSAYTRGWFFR